MIGGAFQKKSGWRQFEQEFLASGRDVLTVDPPGWGAGDILPKELGAEALADAVHHMITENGLPRVDVLGVSYGTAIGYRLAERHPEQVGRAVLLGAMTSIPDHACAAIQESLDHLAARRMEQFAETLLALLMDQSRLDVIENGARIHRFLRHRLSTLSHDEIEQTYANSQRLLTHRAVATKGPAACPVLVIVGEYDPFTTTGVCRELAGTCADSWYVEIARTDHMAYLERTVEVAEVAAAFLSGQHLTNLPACHRAERISSPVRLEPATRSDSPHLAPAESR